MTFHELAKKRVSVRDYTLQPIEEEKLGLILEAARMAPSAVNYQPWRFVVISSEQGREAVYRCYPREWIRPAPLFILVCGNHDESWTRKSDNKDHLDVDMGIVIEHICLAAADVELGTCIICNFDTTLCRSLFHLPENMEPIAFVSIGYPSNPEIFTDSLKKRKGLSEVVLRESF